ncbi:MAG: hypothetical protein C9356_14830 [Oleiphilus sp.]|nr:MAG: hypothetical protein C9356_14830 [Oleiphilus sp.]
MFLLLNLNIAIFVGMTVKFGLAKALMWLGLMGILCVLVSSIVSREPWGMFRYFRDSYLDGVGTILNFARKRGG